MTYQILRLPAVKQQTGLSRSTLYKLVSLGRFPKQIDLGGGRAVGWLESDVQAWIKSRLVDSRMEG
jgi:prophage regulatory protein